MVRVRKNRAYNNAYRRAKGWLQKYWRVYYSDNNGWCQCVTCGNMFLWNDKDGRMQGAHFVPARDCQITALMFENGLPACSYCNKEKHNKDEECMKVFEQKLEEIHGKGIGDKIRTKRAKGGAYSLDQLNRISNYWKGRTQELIKNKFGKRNKK